MSTLTKICVVVLVLLVFASCPIFIQQAVAPVNWKEAWKAEADRRKLADAKAREEELVAGTWKRQYEDEKARAERLFQQLQSEAESKRDEVARLTTLLNDKQANIQSLALVKTGLEKALNRAVALTESQRTELINLRKSTIDLSDQLRSAQAKIDECVAKLTLMERGERQLKDQIVQKDAEIKDLRLEMRRLKEAGVTLAEETPKVLGPKIEASVTAVKDDLASLNVGSASGVKKGMQFIVYRGADFVAHLQVEYVAASTCSGIVVDAQLDVKKGDKATTSLEVE